jgi:carboxylesterase type B
VAREIAAARDDMVPRRGGTSPGVWANFEKTGNPNGGNLPVWPKFDPEKRAYLDFTNAGPVAKEGLRRAVCDLYTEKLKRRISP